jgi:hypothetical protein
MNIFSLFWFADVHIQAIYNKVMIGLSTLTFAVFLKVMYNRRKMAQIDFDDED